ncbi:hypothetical protein [Bifidobacterium sp. ESL0745]|uniref:hypothetical protein n=1 Tax=Bifidobacterium sp. ESL0745 TaxID=2983226 RepID=UPI0023F76284|nr:hypothetical protein [Bifidobacterium sp. ESL0745]MDF7665750.1 hypothetical protein [Bifidobacterium sp. ESL0745]
MSEATRTLKVSTPANTEVTAEISYEDSTFDDMWEGYKLGIKHYLGGKIVLTHNGKRVGSVDLVDTGFGIKPYERTVKGYAGWVYDRVLLDDASDKAIKQAVKEVMDEATSDEIKEQRAEKEAKDHAEMVASARRTIAKAEAQRDIPSKTEKRRRLRVYNDINNEGGDGYLPEIIDADQYRKAKEYLAKEGIDE